jgi:MFS family permease
MIASLDRTYQKYPRQFWLMFTGMLISTIGGSMIWPFLMIYVSENLRVQLTVAASMMTLNSIAGLIASFFAGPIIDRIGRKWIMVFSLLLNGLGYLFLGNAESLPLFAILMGLIGIAQPLYRIGGDAMLADLVPEEKRADGYALLRLSNNIGVAMGPAIGGFLAATSYRLAFSGAAAGMMAYSLLLAFFAIETLPKYSPAELETKNEPLGGYPAILRDTRFMNFAFAYTLVIIVASLMWVLLPVYAKQNYAIPESLYGWIPTTNALMVVTMQISVTRITKRYPTLPVLALGAAFYTIAVASITAGSGFWAFWVSMVIMTIGELILIPTASTYAANLAPLDKRGRYMSIFGLSWRIAIGAGPILGGLLNDNLGPKAIWYGGALIGLAGACFFLIISRRMNTQLKEVAYAYEDRRFS